MKRVRVLVANHPRLMRELVMATIADQPDIEVVGEVQNESDLAETVEQSQPDVLTDMDLKRMSEFHFRHQPVATIGLYQVPDPSRCGVAVTDSRGVIVDFEEKPQNPRSNWVFSGLMVAGPRLFDSIPDSIPPSIPADIGFHVLPRLLGRMMAYPIHDYLLDIGTLPNYQKAQFTWPFNYSDPGAGICETESYVLGGEIL